MRAWRTPSASSWPLKPCWSLQPLPPLHNPRSDGDKLASSSSPSRSPASSAPRSRGPLFIAATVSTLGGLLFGYDNIVISGAIGYLGRLFHLDAAGTGWAAGCALLGCIVGCAFAGTVGDHLGKKKGLARCGICFALSSAGMLFASNLHQFVV